MIVTCETADLNRAIQAVMSAIPSKPSTPIFGGIHLLAGENTLELQGMDLNMAIKYTIKAQVEEQGEILIASNIFNGLVKNLEGETVTLSKSKEESNLILKAGKTEYKILLMVAEDYPKFPDFNGEQAFTIGDEKIKELIKKTAFACATDVSRPLFTGVLCEIKNGIITFVGTNTHRLAIKSMPMENAPDLSIIIPSGILKEIVKNLNGKVPQEVKLSLLNNQLMVIIDELVIVSRVIEGKYPDYTRVIPPSFAVKTKVNCKELSGAVTRMSLCSGSENDYNFVKMIIDAKEITVMSSSPEVGTGEEIISCETEGEPVKVAFNTAYILDILNNVKSDEATIELNNSLSPVCIKLLEDNSYTYIVTPIRVIF